MRALWDYYKINGIIESKYCQLKKGGDQEGRFDGRFLEGLFQELSNSFDTT